MTATVILACSLLSLGASPARADEFEDEGCTLVAQDATVVASGAWGTYPWALDFWGVLTVKARAGADNPEVWCEVEAWDEETGCNLDCANGYVSP